MNPKIYIETTIVSYLTAKPSVHIIVAAHQQITGEWWENKRVGYDLYAPQLVFQESKAGDPLMADKRLQALESVQPVEVTEEALALAEALIAHGAVPEKAAEDALHIAVSVVHGMDYLLTWNCKHIANAKMRNKIEAICRLNGYEPVIMCTPEELMED